MFASADNIVCRQLYDICALLQRTRNAEKRNAPKHYCAQKIQRARKPVNMLHQALTPPAAHIGSMSYSPSSSSNSPSSSAVASWYCWYSDTRSFKLLSFGELHLVHALSRVPVQKCLAAEHARVLLSDALEHLLDRSAVPDEGDGHLQALGRDVAHAALHVVRDPLHEVRRVLVLRVEHLLVNLLRRHPAAEQPGHRQVPPVPRISCAHHVLRVEHLLRRRSVAFGLPESHDDRDLTTTASS